MNILPILIYMRKKRKLEKGARYHVIARANRQEFILNSPEVKELFLTVLKQAKRKYPLKVITVCIMGNHVHLLLMPLENANLSKIMQWILSVFAIRFNRWFNLKGHVWYDRFKSNIIKNYRQFQNTFVYISENPVKAKLVRDPSAYIYNGLFFIKQGNFDILDPPDLLISALPLPIIPAFLTG